MDLRVFDQRSKSYENKSLHQCYVMNKNDKKTLHLVLSSRKSNFYPISFSSKWSYGQRNQHILLANNNNLAEKKDRTYSVKMALFRRNTFFLMLSTLMGMGGSHLIKLESTGKKLKELVSKMKTKVNFNKSQTFISN